MNDQERRELLGRVERSSRTIGGSIPDELTVQGRTVALNEVVFRYKRLETTSETERERLEDLKRDLRRERLARKRRIERETLSREAGERLVETIHGIDRAINALENLDGPDVSEELRQKEREDARELLTLIERGTL